MWFPVLACYFPHDEMWLFSPNLMSFPWVPQSLTTMLEICSDNWPTPRGRSVLMLGRWLSFQCSTSWPLCQSSVCQQARSCQDLMDHISTNTSICANSALTKKTNWNLSVLWASHSKSDRKASQKQNPPGMDSQIGVNEDLEITQGVPKDPRGNKKARQKKSTKIKLQK